MPGVSYERAVQFTPHGPVALHVVRGPRPTGLYSLRPVLSNELIPGTERVTTMQKRLSAGGASPKRTVRAVTLIGPPPRSGWTARSGRWATTRWPAA